MDWLGALGAGLEGFHEGQQRDKKEARQDNANAQADYTTNRDFARQKQADAIADTPLNAVAPTQQAGGVGTTGGTGGTQPAPSIGLDAAQAMPPAVAPPPTVASPDQQAAAPAAPAPAPQQPATANTGDPYLAEQGQVLKSLQMKRQAALQANRQDLWNAYGTQEDQVRASMVGRAAQQGLQQYGLNQDINALLPAANLVHDGVAFGKAEKNADGSITITRTQFNNPAPSLTFQSDKDGTADQKALMAFRNYLDPATAAANAKKTDDLIWEGRKTMIDETAKAQAENLKNKELRPGGSLIGPNGQVLGTAPNPPEFGTMKNPGENGGDSLFNKNTGQLAPGPAGAAGSGGEVYKRVVNIMGKLDDTNVYDPSRAAFTLKQLTAQNPGQDPQVVDVATHIAMTDPSKMVIRADRQSGQLGVYVDAGTAGALRIGDLSQAKQLLVSKDDKTGRTAPLSDSDLSNALTTGSQTAKQQWLDDLKTASPAIYRSATSLTPTDIKALRTGKGTVAASDGSTVDIAQVPVALRQQILTANQYVGDTAKAAPAPAANTSTIKKMADTAQARTDARQSANIEASPLDLVRAKVGKVGEAIGSMGTSINAIRDQSVQAQLDELLPRFKQGGQIPSTVADQVKLLYDNESQAAKDRITSSLTPAQLSAILK